MKHIKLYEEFIMPEVETDEATEVETDTDVTVDSNGVIHIKNWLVY